MDIRVLLAIYVIQVTQIHMQSNQEKINNEENLTVFYQKQNYNTVSKKKINETKEKNNM